MAISRFIRDVFGFPPPPDAATAPAQPPSRPPHAASFDYEDPRIPVAARGRIANVLALIAHIEAGAAGEASWSPLLGEIGQLSEVHLPKLVKSYVDIPAAHRAEIFRKTGHSASFMLNEGLDKMIERLTAMSLSLAQGNIDAFTSNMRFIDMRYGPNQLAPD